jgi:hypothetical protein
MLVEKAVVLRCFVFLLLRATVDKVYGSPSPPRYQLLGLACGGHELMSPTVLTAAVPTLGDICALNFTVMTSGSGPHKTGDGEADETALLLVVVEHSPVPVPAARGSTVLLASPVASGTQYYLLK